jgi:murein DD-endopeptidase MepM/ murein hydrolase activator NlpD
MPRWPTGPFEIRRTGCYGCVRTSSADGACGVHGYPCVHRGMDLFAKDSTVVAPDSGVVVAVSDGSSAPWRGYGPGVVVIRGDSGEFLLLSHLDYSSISVGVGERVTEGQIIAQFNARIAHTHFEVRRELVGPSETNALDPSSWVSGGLFKFVLIGFVLWGGWRLWGEDLV